MEELQAKEIAEKIELMKQIVSGFTEVISKENEALKNGEAKEVKVLYEQKVKTVAAYRSLSAFFIKNRAAVAAFEGKEKEELKELSVVLDKALKTNELLLKTNTTQVLSAKDIAELMNKSIDMSKLAQLLQSHGKEAAEKISKLIATLHQSGIYNTQQLKEMSVLINACIPTPDTSQSAMLKSLMLMYLPWLPLSGEAGFSIDFEQNENSGSDDSDSVVTIIITTKNYGQVKVLLVKSQNNLDIDLTCDENFPKKDFQDAIKNNSTGFDMENNISFTTRKTQEDSDSQERKINFTNSAKVSPHLLLVIHMIINVIVEIDKKAELLNQRKNAADS